MTVRTARDLRIFFPRMKQFLKIAVEQLFALATHHLFLQFLLSLFFVISLLQKITG